MTSTFGLGRALRATARAREILTVLARHGFQDVAEDLQLHRPFDWIRRLLRRPPRPAAPTSEAERVRRAMEELGGTFVKLGQILSTRPDLVPEGWAQEFEKLQSAAAPVPWNAIDDVLTAEFGARRAELFDHIDPEPLAAASMAQVHRARLRDGTAVVVKVLRPRVRETVAADLHILHALARLLEHRFENVGYSPVAVVEQVGRELERETDLLREAQSTDRLGRAFADDPHVRFPTVHWHATTSSVLTMEEITGLLLATRGPDDLDAARSRRVVEHCVRAVFRQCLELGFFHADPHPGNVFVLEDDSVCFIDCGMTGHVDPDTAWAIADLIRGVVGRDLDLVAKTAVSLTGSDPGLAYDRRLRADVWELMVGTNEISLANLRVGALLQDFFHVLRRNRLRCPADLVHLIKVIATVEGVAEALDPGFDVVAFVRPNVERLVRTRYGIGALRRRLERSMLGYATVLESLPTRVAELFDRLQRHQLGFDVEHRGLEGLTEEIESASVNISYALTIAALIIGSCVLLLANAVGDGSPWFGALAACSLAGSIVIAGWRLVRLWLAGK